MNDEHEPEHADAPPETTPAGAHVREPDDAGEGGPDDTADTADGASDAERQRAERRRAGRRRVALARLGHSLRHASRGQVLGGVLVGLLGFATVTQVQARDADDQYDGLRQADLIQLLNGLNAQSRRAEAEINDLRRARSQLTDSSQRREAATARAREEAGTLGILAGTLAATGPGVRITINDPGGRLSLNNLLDAVEELRSAGAEAMEFNDSVRVVAETSFEQTGDGLIVGGQRLEAPYVITAIGNPDTLAPVVDFAEGLAYDVRQAGGSVTVDKLDTVRIGAVVKPEPTQFASPSG